MPRACPTHGAPIADMIELQSRDARKLGLKSEEIIAKHNDVSDVNARDKRDLGLMAMQRFPN